ncbi:hypothetical protein GJ744_009341 [Endocarpon pusillum]|uniref:Uncharacterized protein n=1 Tax=Endocarpon pusillum TaxID=364733 RepID=A0A8H7AFU5_9EURO|nr:hypothetical protein GJ744_009341 [Endocarpon pusillum]
MRTCDPAPSVTACDSPLHAQWQIQDTSKIVLRAKCHFYCVFPSCLVDNGDESARDPFIHAFIHPNDGLACVDDV